MFHNSSLFNNVERPLWIKCFPQEFVTANAVSKSFVKSLSCIFHSNKLTDVFKCLVAQDHVVYTHLFDQLLFKRYARLRD